jgi:hypothetical protein
MIATEHIVEAYFRLCENCFTTVDKKVIGGVNRQFDLLAFNPKNKKQYHVETSITHSRGFSVELGKMRSTFAYKFFGIQAQKEKSNQMVRGQSTERNLFQQILDTYTDIGFDTEQVNRIFVKWMFKEPQYSMSEQVEYELTNPIDNKTYVITVMSMRDCIIPKLAEKISTANYDDEIFRTLSLLKEREKQIGAALTFHKSSI